MIRDYESMEVTVMWFWWFMFICNLIVPVIMIIAGRMMWKHCPQKINSIYGYRTGHSMKNMDTWKFAHDYCGHLWYKLGWLMLVPSELVQIPFFRSSEDVIGIVGAVLCTIQVVILIASIFPTEAALRKAFHEDGTRRDN